HLSIKLDEAGGDRTARRDESAEGRASDKSALGVSVAPDKNGLVVEDVDPDGRAADAGIRAGDVILEVNRQSVKSIDELRAAIRKSTDKPTLLLVSRNGTDVYVTVKPS